MTGSGCDAPKVRQFKIDTQSFISNHYRHF